MSFFTKLFRRHVTAKPRRRKVKRSFKPQLEGLETRLVPVVYTADYWEPGNNLNTTYKWSEDANWALGHKPTLNNNEIAEFSASIGNGIGNYNCEEDIATVSVSGVDFLDSWSKKFTLDAGNTLTCDDYINAASVPEITMGSTTSNLLVQENGNHKQSTIGGGTYFDGAKGSFTVAGPAGLSTPPLFVISSTGYTDSDFYMGTPTNHNLQTQINFPGTTGFTVGQHNNVAFWNLGQFVFVRTGTPGNIGELQNGVVTNTYLYNATSGVMWTNNGTGSDQEINMPIYNSGSMELYGGFTMDGARTATDCKDANGNYYHYFQTGNSSAATFFGAANKIFHFTCNANKCLGYYQSSGSLGFDANLVNGSTDIMSLDSTYADSGRFTFTGGNVIMSNSADGVHWNLTFKDSLILGSGKATLTATNTTFTFYVDSGETSWSQLTITRIAMTADTTDTFKIYGGKSTTHGRDINLTIVTTTNGGTLSGSVTYNFTNTADGGTGWTGTFDALNNDIAQVLHS